MCGIIGYVGREPACAILLKGLSLLEYRGYDSAGVALLDGSRMQIRKSVGRVEHLCRAAEGLPGCTGIGHTRWATHGQPTEANCHPHVSGHLAVVHNGIIENYRELKRALEARWAGRITEAELIQAANDLRKENLARPHGARL